MNHVSKVLIPEHFTNTGFTRPVAFVVVLKRPADRSQQFVSG